MTLLRRLPLALLGVLGATPPLWSAEAARSAALEPAWQALSVGASDEAGDAFERAGGREAQLGAAIALVNRPPVTREETRRRFEALAAGDDEAARAARYFLGRLRQLDPDAPDPAGAAQRYEALVATGADDLWCRLALIKLVILRLTVLPAAGDLAARLAAVEPALARTRDPGTQRDLHVVIAEARLNHRAYDSVTLGHLEAALALTPSGDALRADLLVQAGRLSSLLGRRADARERFTEFVRDYPKERRAFTVNAALADLGAPTPP